MMCTGRAFGTVLLVAGLITGGAGPSSAQAVASTFDDLRSGAYRGKSVYVTDQAGLTVKGRVVSLSAVSIELLVKGEPREWRVADVAWITQRHGHARRGALMGLVVGASLGAVAVLQDSSCQNSHYRGCARDDAEVALFLAGLFGGIGAGAGVAIGAATRSEYVLYASPGRVTTLGRVPIVPPGVIGLRAQFRL